MQVRIEYDVNRIISQIELLIREIDLSFQDQLGIWREAAKPIVSAIKQNTPVGTEEKHYYYDGKKDKTAPPGTLRDSIMILPTIHRAVIIGSYHPYYSSGNASFVLYFFMVEYGTRYFPGAGFMRKGVAQGQGECLRIMARGYDKMISGMVKKTKR